MAPKYTNALAGETSPYLLQHAHNPVNWEPWSEQALERARKEGKPLLISIGYAACHWCHVMEAESFEDEAVATLMNREFINIKIDREERPDLDQVYMDALQLMTGSGGWPLNIIALPDGRPFWGATYVQKKSWIQVLEQLAALYKKDAGKVNEYANNLSLGIQEINRVPDSAEALPDKAGIKEALYSWAEHFDARMGGNRGAPKFMMPVTMELLLHYTALEPDKLLEDHLHTTLTRMAYGGIYDHVGGGFSRYSVDARWHVPHFEKMLYDNAQLVSLYCKAYAKAKNPLYKKIAEGTLEFVERELSDGQGAYYASLDADSPDENNAMKEGAFYTWREEPLKQLLGPHYPVFRDYYNINAYGRWEEDTYVLIRNEEAESIAASHNISLETLEGILQECLGILREERAKRTPPGLDTKVLTGWNAWMLLALSDAYRYLGDERYLTRALRCAAHIREHLHREGGGLLHTKGKDIPGFLEDYAALIRAYSALFETSGQEQFLFTAKELLTYCMEHFSDPESGLFFFTDQDTPVVVRRSLETGDNVIPSSNAVMAGNLLLLHKHFATEGYLERTAHMLKKVQENFKKYAHGHAFWMQVLLMLRYPFHELVILGPEHEAYGAPFMASYLPNCILAKGAKEGSVPLFRNRLEGGSTLIYHCREGACELPSKSPEEVLQALDH